MASVEAFRPTTALAPLRRFLGLERLARFSLLGLAGGALLGTLCLIVAQLTGFPTSRTVAVVIVGAGLLVGAAEGFKRWPGITEAARNADRHLGLHDRLTTAVELEASSHPISDLQRRDVELRVRGVHLHKQRSGWLSRREGLPIFIAVAAFVIMFFFAGTPVVGGRSGAGQDQQRIRETALVRIPSLVKQATQGAPQQNSTIKKLNKSLLKLRLRLLKTSTRAAALRAISATQEEVSRLQKPAKPQDNRASGTARSALSGAKSGKGSAPRSNGPPNAVNKSTGRSLKGARRGQGANGQGSQSQTKQLNANGLRRGNPTASATEKDLQKRVNLTKKQLDDLKNFISGLNKKKTGQNLRKHRGRQGAPRLKTGLGQARGRRGKTSGRGRSQTPGGANSPGRNTRTTNNGSGSSNPSAQKRVTGRYRITGGHGGLGLHPPKATSAGTKGTYYFTYLPGKHGQGPRLVLRSQSPGAPYLVAPVGYQRILVRYARAVHSRVGQSNLPPSIRSFVRRYFDALAH